MLKRFVAALGVLLMVASVGTPVAAAQQAAQQTPGQGLEISPPLIDLKTDPGKTLTVKINLRNITKATLVATPQVNDFVAQGEEGQPKLLLDQNAKEQSPYSIKGWIAELPTLTLAPQELKTETIPINVPQNASPGGHYGVIRFTAAPPGLEGTGVSLSASIGSLVLIRVSGNIVEKASFAEFYASQNGQKKTLFEYGPVTFVERIKNEGNVHFKPSGTIRVTGTFGGQVAVLTVNEKGGNVLPASIRRFEQTLNKKHLFGRYKAEANVEYNGKNISQTITFWVIPYKLIAIILGVLLILVAGIRSGLKKYVRRAVKKAQNKKEE